MKPKIVFVLMMTMMLIGTGKAAPPLYEDVGIELSVEIGGKVVLAIHDAVIIGYEAQPTLTTPLSGIDIIAVLPQVIYIAETEPAPTDSWHWHYYQNKPLGTEPNYTARSRLSC